MLDSRYKAPWRRLLTGANPTIGELFALAGSNAATIGWCGGSQAVPGFVRLAGYSAAVTAWGASALAATRLELKNGRVMGNLARGIVAGLPQPSASLPARAQVSRVDISLGAMPNAPAGVVRSGSISNPFSVPAPVLISSSGLARYLTINGSRVSYSAGSFDRVETTVTLGVGESLSWALVSDGTWAGGDVAFVISGPDLPPTPPGDPVARAADNASSAIPALDLVATVPWFPYAESFARAGTWVRREYWTDLTRKVRFEAGLGNSPAVLVETVGSLRQPIRAGSFEMEEYLGDDWRPFGAAPADALLIDFTDFRFETSALTGFFFAVDRVIDPEIPDEDSGTDDSGVDPTPPGSDADVEELNGTIQTPAAEVYPLIQQALYRTRITSFTHALREGACSVDLLVDGVSWSTNSIVDVGSRLDLQISAPAGAAWLSFTLGLKRE